MEEQIKFATCIVSGNGKPLSFPHWIRKDKGNVYDILQNPDKQMLVGDVVAFNNNVTPKSEYACTIIKKDTLGKAKGNWATYGFTPIVARVTLQPNTPPNNHL